MTAQVAQHAARPQSSPTISVVIPAHNEADKIAEAIASIQHYALDKGWDMEVVVVDDGSSDATSQCARDAASKAASLAVRVLRNEPNQGKGFSVRRGMMEATGALRLFCDADMSTPIEAIDALLPWVDKGFDVVIGSRRAPGSVLKPPQRFSRRTMGRVFRRLRSMILLSDIRDTQCGFKLFTAAATTTVFPLQEVQGPAFDCEILALAQVHGYRIKEVGVLWRNDPDSRIRPVRDGLGMLLSLLRIRRRIAGMRRSASPASRPRQFERSV